VSQEPNDALCVGITGPVTPTRPGGPPCAAFEVGRLSRLLEHDFGDWVEAIRPATLSGGGALLAEELAKVGLDEGDLGMVGAEGCDQGQQ